MVRQRIVIALASLLLTACGKSGFPGSQSALTDRELTSASPTPGTAWNSLSPMPLGTFGAASAVFNGKVLLFGGVTWPEGPEAYTHAFEYDPATETWTSLPAMPVGSYVLTAHTVGDKVFIIAGWNLQGFMRDVLAYDPVARSWSQRAQRPTYSYNFASAVVDGRIFVIGGHGTFDNGPFENGKPWVVNDHLEIYDPATDSWSTGTPAPAPISGGVACAIGRRIYTLGDYMSGVAVTYAYDVDSDSWSIEPPPKLTDGQSCVVANDEMYVIGGHAANAEVPSNIVQIFSPQTHEWRDAPQLTSNRLRTSAALVGNTVLVFGGQQNAPVPDELLDTVEALDIGVAR